jgi:hypothetical protein
MSEPLRSPRPGGDSELPSNSSIASAGLVAAFTAEVQGTADTSNTVERSSTNPVRGPALRNAGSAPQDPAEVASLVNGASGRGTRNVAPQGQRSSGDVHPSSVHHFGLGGNSIYSTYNDGGDDDAAIDRILDNYNFTCNPEIRLKFKQQ